MAKSRSEELIWTCGTPPSSAETHPPRYDIVVLLGCDMQTKIRPLKAAAERAAARGISTCIIGDGGKESFITRRMLSETLHERIDENTNIIINGHGIVRQQIHMISIYRPDTERKTSALLMQLQSIFAGSPTNMGKKMTIDIFSCYASAAQDHAPSGLRLTTHGTSQYTTLADMNLDVMVAKVDHRTETSLDDHYDDIMRRITRSPEILIYTENKKKLRADPPRVPLSPDGLKRYLQKSLSDFLVFRRDELGHKGMGDDTVIAEKAKAFEIREETLKRYNELDLIRRCSRRAFQDRERYIRRFTEQGGNINAINTSGQSALYMTTYFGHEETAKALVNVGALQSTYGTFTSLMLAAHYNRPGVARFLLAKITDPAEITRTAEKEQATAFCTRNHITIPESMVKLFGKTAEEIATTPEIKAMIRQRLTTLAAVQITPPPSPPLVTPTAASKETAQPAAAQPSHTGISTGMRQQKPKITKPPSFAELVKKPPASMEQRR